ncbi:uncharacterized protein LOC131249746 [Magnolia sinica]|uniref:uncharacterized protein LOC131249746 n=1 Tax=Magnolia sinica TaxID=86752 RepID=UPI00265B09A6|nr:uncharacterized protein LOC131249746 [Magnolia sinica]
MKLNVDGSARGNSRVGGGGGACMDHQGSLVFSFHNKYGSITNNIAEAQAMVDGLKICADKELNNIIMEIDSRIIHEAVSNLFHSCGWKLWYRLEIIHQFVQPLNLRFSHTLREGNSVADGLAKIASSGAPDKTYICLIPILSGAPQF